MYSLYIRDKMGRAWTSCTLEHYIVHILENEDDT